MSNIAIRIIRYLMQYRAYQHFKLFQNQLNHCESILDVGSGTGDFGAVLRKELPIQVTEVDICDFSMHGFAPTLYDGNNLPFEKGTFDTVSLLGVLHYSPKPEIMLDEARRVAKSQILLLQTASEPTWYSRLVHRIQEAFEGQYAWWLAKKVGCFTASDCPLTPLHFMTYEQLCEILNQRFDDWKIVKKRRSYMMGVGNYFLLVNL